MRNVDDLMKAILRLKGKKVLTLSSNKGADNFAVDIDPDGVFGYQEGVKEIFLAKLHSAVHAGGGLIIRQFTGLKILRTLPHGKRVWIPCKNIYGVMLGNNQLESIPADEMRNIHGVDTETGEGLPKENGVYFKELG